MHRSKRHPYSLTSLLRSSYCTGTGRSYCGLKNRLAMDAKMIGVKPITAASPLPITPDLKSP
jgi:hypothetical protein